MTRPASQTDVLLAALALAHGVPTRNYIQPAAPWEHACEMLAAEGLMVRRQSLGGAVFYTVTGAGVREVCPDAKAAVYLPTGDDVTVFAKSSGRWRMRWDGPDKGRFQQGVVYRVSDAAVRVKEAT